MSVFDEKQLTIGDTGWKIDIVISDDKFNFLDFIRPGIVSITFILKCKLFIRDMGIDDLNLFPLQNNFNIWTNYKKCRGWNIVWSEECPLTIDCFVIMNNGVQILPLRWKILKS